MDKPQRIVILVHGTFALGAAWTKTKSVLCHSLCRQLGENLIFHRLDWSGRNKHADRLAGSSRLQRHIATLTAQYPQASLHLIGHSHGGNIIRYALQEDAVAQQVNSVITLATPFICCGKRENIQSMGVLLAGLAILLCLVVASLSLYWVIAQACGAAVDPVGLYGFAAVICVGFGLLLAHNRRQLTNLITQWVSDTQTRVVNSFHGTHSIQVPFLCIRFTGDEAAFGLAFSSRISAIFAAYNQVAQQIFVWALHHRIAAALMGFLLANILGLGQLLGEAHPLSTYKATGLLLLSLLLTQMLLAIPLFLLTYWVSWAAFGVKNERFYDGLFAELTTHPTHPLLADVTELEFSKTYALRKMGLGNALKFMLSFGLSHSMPYANEDALGFMARWLLDNDQRHRRARQKRRNSFNQSSTFSNQLVLSRQAAAPAEVSPLGKLLRLLIKKEITK